MAAEIGPPSLRDTFEPLVGPVVESVVQTGSDLIPRLWWLWVLLALILAARVLRFAYRQRQLARSGIREIDAMDGQTFERYLATMFRRLGYRVEQVGSSRGDYGGDLVIVRDGARTIVQAKRYNGRAVGVKAVQEAHAARAVYRCTGAMVVTNSGYSQQARKLARDNGVELWGREELLSKLLRAEKATERPEPAPAVRRAKEPTPSPEVWATCGETLSEKVLAYCREHAERFGGRAYCYAHQRRFRTAGRAASA